MTFSPLLTKGILGIGAVGVTATGVAYIGGAFSKVEKKEELVSKLIRVSNPEKRIISSGDLNDFHWKEAWKLYREDNRNKNPNEDLWKLQDWTKPADGDISNSDPAIRSFVDECNSRLSKTVSGIESRFYKQALVYCTRDTTVSDLISENNKDKTLLDTSLDDQNQDWKNAWTSYKEKNKDKEANQDPLKLESWGSKKTEDTLPTDYRSKCGSKAKIKTFDLNNEDYYIDVLAWCTK